MKRILTLLLLMFTCIVGVNANTLKKIDVDAFINSDGSMHVIEVWSMNTNKDTEIYKEEYDLGNMEITNFLVSDESQAYTLNENWNINGSFESKKYQYG